jgi:ABC-2 type transport system ATP-binding protein
VTEPAIRCQSLVKEYPGGVRAVRGLDLEVRRGECFGLLGPNGAGKTTTIEILEGILAPTSGEVEVLGGRWGEKDRELRERIGISLQETKLTDKLTVRETLRLFRSFYSGGFDPEEGIDIVELREKADARVEKLSGGQRQRLAVATALIGRPELLFLDEPTTGLDPQSRRQVWDLLRRFRSEGRTILITTHYMDEAERLCDRVAVIDHGRVIALGSPRELIASLGGEHVVELALDSGAPERTGLREEELLALPHVSAVRSNGAEAALTVTEPHVVLPALLDLIQRVGSTLTQLSIRHASLEDVFVKLTGRHLRDGGT